MGRVYQYNKGLVRNWPEDGSFVVTEAVINPGQANAPVAVASFSAQESKTLLLKLDALCSNLNNSLISNLVAENAENVFVAVRMAKAQAKGVFAGILGAGTMLDIKWLRPKDIGGAILSPASTSGTGLYGGTGAAVFTWLASTTANNSKDLIPAQTMEQFASVIHLGAIEPIEVPKMTDITFTLGGQATPAESIGQNIKQFLGTANNDIQVTRFEKAIIVGPLQSQYIKVMPGISGSTKFQLLSIICARIQELTA
jgi:hypothetical protein